MTSVPLFNCKLPIPFLLDKSSKHENTQGFLERLFCLNFGRKYSSSELRKLKFSINFLLSSLAGLGSFSSILQCSISKAALNHTYASTRAVSQSVQRKRGNLHPHHHYHTGYLTEADRGVFKLYGSFALKF